MFHRISFVVLAFVMFFAAVVRADFPACAQPCLGAAPHGSCSLTDNACMCSNASYCNATNLCFKNSCSQTDWKSAYDQAVAMCNAAGVTQPVILNPPTKRAAAPEPVNTAFVPVYVRRRN
ncbi:hypothetical protein BDV93DRAFT_553096 [Ceratobasidium sp. AG-I]|nr:hypothetical protein BDV93DRAFT_553096 [Ceratobasidium sp. AG-I]